MRRLSDRSDEGSTRQLDRRRVLKVSTLGLLALGGARPVLASKGKAVPAPTCILVPKQTEGPYYLDLDLIRTDLREDRVGVPLALELTVVQAKSCEPIPGAVVDVWHCDADGTYSGFAQEAEADHHGRRRRRRKRRRRRATDDSTFLRGLQTTDREGKVRFETIFPGWYPGRVTHVHFKIHVGRRTAVTSQLYFPEDLTHEIYGQSDPYRARGLGDTTLADDGVLDDFGGARQLVMSVHREPAGVTATHVLGIKR